MHFTPMENKVGILLLAAGLSSRFGENKLLYPVCGVPMAEHMMQITAGIPNTRVAVVTAYPSVAQLAEKYGAQVCENRNSNLGIGHSVSLGTQALRDTMGILVLPCDMPFFRRETVKKMVDAFFHHSCTVVAADSGKLLHPFLFHHTLFPRLLALSGDGGGRSIALSQQENMYRIPVDPREQMDIDQKDQIQ